VTARYSLVKRTIGTLALAAALQILPVDPVMRRVSIGAVSAVCLMAAMIFFLFAVKDRE